MVRVIPVLFLAIFVASGSGWSQGQGTPATSEKELDTKWKACMGDGAVEVAIQGCSDFLATGSITTVSFWTKRAWEHPVSDDSRAQAYKRRGELYDRTGQKGLALSDYRAATRLAPTDADAHMRLGNASLLQRDLDEALRGFDEAIRLDPTLARAFFARGGVLYVKGDKVRAQEDFNRGTVLDPALAAALEKRAKSDELRALFAAARAARSGK